MTMDLFFRSVRSQFRDLSAYLWNEGGADRLLGKTDRLAWDLRRRYSLLIQQRAVIEGLHHRLAENQRREAFLMTRVETYLHVSDQANAWRYALELEQTQKTLARDRCQLAIHDRAYQDQLADVEQIKIRLAQLREKLYVQPHGMV